MKVDIKKIIELRKANKLTISQVAKYLNKARCTVSCWENNRTLPVKTDLIALAQLLGTRVSEISTYNDLPKRIHSTDSENNFNLRNTINELDVIISENKELELTGIKSLKAIIKENRRLDSANRSLKKNNTRLTSTMDSIHEIIYIKDNKRIFKKVNEKFLEQLQPGYTEGDIIGTKSIDIFGRKEIADIVPLENKVFKTGQRIIDKKIKIPGSAGKKHGLISIEPIFDELDKVIEISVSIKDVTDIVENIEKLELLESVSNMIDEQIWIMTENPLKYEFIGGSGFQKTYGIPKENFKNNPLLLFNMIHPDDKTEYLDKKNNLFLPLGEHTFRILNKNNSIRWINYKAFRTYDLNNKPIIYGLTSDITETTLQEQSLKYLDDAINKSKDTIWVGNYYSKNGNTKFKYTYLSGRPDRLLGVNKLQLQKNNLSWVENVHPLDKDKVQKWLNNENKYPKNIDYRIQLSDKTTKWVYSKFCCKNNIHYGTFYDITKRKEQELKREIMEKAMSKAKDAMWVYDSKFNCILITAATEKLYDMSFKNIKNPIQYWVDNKLHPDYKIDYSNRLENFKKQKKSNPYFTPNTFIFKTVNSDGTIRYIESLFTCMKYDNEVYDIAVDRDITMIYEDTVKLKKIKKLIQNILPVQIKNEILNLIN